MTVTEIVPLDKRRSKVFLDEDFAFVLSGEELAKYRLEIGTALEESSYQEILSQIVYPRARVKAMDLLAASDKTEEQLCRSLARSGFPPEAADRAVAYVKSRHFVDDEEFARRYIQAQRSRKSRKKIAYELDQRGLSRETVEDLLGEETAGEEEAARKYMKKRGYADRPLTSQELQKAFAALARQGFAYETARAVVEELMRPEDE